MGLPLEDNHPDKRKSTGIIRHLITDQLQQIGRLPPQAPELEEAVLGAILLEKPALIRVIDILKPECFYLEKHEIVYRAVMELFAGLAPVDIETVSEWLKKAGLLDLVGGRYFISSLTSRVASSENIEFHARIILQKFIQRESIRIFSEGIKVAYEDQTDVFELLNRGQTAFNNLLTGIMRKSEQGTTVLAKAFLNKLDQMATSTTGITGVPTTLTMLDGMTRGFQNGDLVIIAGRPGMGKTAALKPIIKGCINKLQGGVLFFSLEMTANQIVERLISEDVQVETGAFNSKEFLDQTDFNKITAAFTKYYSKSGKDLLHIDDTPALHINELRARAKLVCSQKDIRLILVDYAQIVDGGDSELEAYRIGNVTKGLKQLAKELNIPVIALAQLNREADKRDGVGKGKEPKLSDLRSSGNIEQDADMVIFLHRPEYYGIEQDEDGNSTHQLAYWIIAKARSGGAGRIETRFVSKFTQFMDWDGGSRLAMTGTAQPPPPPPPPTPYDPTAGLAPSDDFPVQKYPRQPFNEPEDPF